ncbi:MAG: nuclear transport factor 2 family protein [Terriglobia bacterium]
MPDEIANLVHRMNRAWREGSPQELQDLLHPDVVMVFPGFGGRSRGASAMISGFEEFCAHARVHEYDESDLQVDVVGSTGAASYAFAMTYEREGRRYRSTGRDLWMFGMTDGAWKATWRTMLDVHEEEVL